MTERDPQVLTDRQRAFVDEFTLDHNAAAAARRAGYSEASSKQRGYELMQHEVVRRAIAEREADMANRLGITKEYLLTRGRAAIEKALDGAPKTTARGEMVYDDEGQPIFEWSPTGAAKALELLMKHTGMLDDRLRVEHAGGLEVRLVGVDVEELK